MLHFRKVYDLRLGAQAIHALALAIHISFIDRFELVPLAILTGQFDVKCRGCSMLQIQCFDATDIPICHINQ